MIGLRLKLVSQSGNELTRNLPSQVLDLKPRELRIGTSEFAFLCHAYATYCETAVFASLCYNYSTSYETRLNPRLNQHCHS